MNMPRRCGRRTATSEVRPNFVMQWWDRAAHILTTAGTRLRRFGFVTTNSITQVLHRQVIEQHFHPVPGAGLPDHPWTKAAPDAAAVKILMTVVEAGSGEGRLIEVEHETGLDTDEPEIRFAEACDVINAGLSVRTLPTRPLRSGCWPMKE